MKNKPYFVDVIRFWSILVLVVLSGAFISLHTIWHIQDTESRIQQVRESYIEKQRQHIKSEVLRLSKTIEYEMDKNVQEARTLVETRVSSAHAMASNLYEQYKGSKSQSEIEKMIINAIRPIRMDHGEGYYFISDLEGTIRLFADQPSHEHQSLLNRQDSRGRYVFRDMIRLVQSSGEGLYSYHWTKPGHQGDDFEKLTYVKRFEPFNWLIGTGIYLDALESDMKKEITRYTRTHHFGPNNGGYAFVYEVEDLSRGKDFARIYANPNLADEIGMTISDDKVDALGKLFRKEMLAGLREHGECYVDYWYKKLNDPLPSPKTSFFKLVGDGRFIVAAGVYMDDIESQIVSMQLELEEKLHQGFILVGVLFFFVLFLVFLLTGMLNRRLKNDFNVFTRFFQIAADSSREIDRDSIRFIEFDRLAKVANKMLSQKAGAEQSLKQTQKRLTQAQQLAGIGHYIYNIQEDTWTSSSELDSIFGIDSTYERDVSGWLNIIHPDYQKMMSDYLEEHLVQQHDEFDVEYKIINQKTGQEKWVYEQISLSFDESGNPVEMFGTTQDITERKIAAEKEKELENQLRQTQKMEAIGTLAGGIAHDFNNVLSGIMGFSQLAKLEINNPEKAEKHIEEILKGSHRAAELTRQILTFSRQGEYQKQPLHISHELKETLKLLRSTIPTTIDIESELDSKEFVLADPIKIHQIIMNLCTNAYHAMKETGGTLTVSLTDIDIHELAKLNQERGVMGKYVQLKVQDTGHGMDEKTIEKVFEPFFTTKPQGEGTGLGLALVHKIVEEHDGFLEVTSEPGKGTCFDIYFPAAGEELIEIAPEINKEIPLMGNENIMVVDDEKSIRQSCKALLEKQGYQVQTFDNGLDALNEFKKAPSAFDLIITDMTMPKLTGDKLAEEVLKIRPDMPVILSTGFSDDISGEAAMELGIRQFFQKPIMNSALITSVRKVLDGNDKLNTHNGQHKWIGSREIISEETASQLPMLNGARILLVEDNLIIQKVVTEFLAKTGIRLSIAENGETALQKVQKQEFDLIFMDIHMPVMDGLTAASSIRSLGGKLKEIPIIAMTANATADDREKSLAAGMNDHISKPMTPEIMFQCLLRWFNPEDVDTCSSELNSVCEQGEADSGEWNIMKEQMPDIDLDKALFSIGGSRALYRTLLADFVRDYSNVISQITTEINNGDILSARRQAHTIKGLSSMLGCTELSSAFARLETAIHQKEGYPGSLLSNCNDIYEKIITQMTNALNALEHCTENSEQSLTQSDVHLVSTDVHLQLDKLKKLLEINDIESVACFESLAKPLSGLYPSESKQLKEAIDYFDFGNALSILARMENNNG